MAVYINNRQFTACEKGQEKNMCLPNLFRNSNTGLATSNYVTNSPNNKRLFERVFKDPVNKDFTMCPTDYINCNNGDCTTDHDPSNLCMNNNTKEFCKPITSITHTDPKITSPNCVYDDNDNIIIKNAPGLYDYTDPQDCLNACEKIIDRDSLYNIKPNNNSPDNLKKNCWGVSVKLDDVGKTTCQYLNDFPTPDSLNDSTLSKLHKRHHRAYNLPDKPSYELQYQNSTGTIIDDPYESFESFTDNTKNDIIDCPDGYKWDNENIGWNYSGNYCVSNKKPEQKCVPKDYYDNIFDQADFSVTDLSKKDKQSETIISNSCQELSDILLGKGKGKYVKDACDAGYNNKDLKTFCTDTYKDTPCTIGKQNCDPTKDTEFIKEFSQSGCEFGQRLSSKHKQTIKLCPDNKNYIGNSILPNFSIFKDGTNKTYNDCTSYSDNVAPDNVEPESIKIKNDTLIACKSGYNDVNTDCEEQLEDYTKAACDVGKNMKKKENKLVNNCLNHDNCSTVVKSIYTSSTPKFSRRIYKYYNNPPSNANVIKVDYPSQIINEKLNVTGKQNYVDIGITSNSLNDYIPNKSTLNDLYNISPFGAEPDGRRKLSSNDYKIFNNPALKGSSSNVVELNHIIGPKLSTFNTGTIDSSSGTALMGHLDNEHFINKCGTLLCDNYRGFVTAAIFIVIITIFLFRYINK